MSNLNNLEWMEKSHCGSLSDPSVMEYHSEADSRKIAIAKSVCRTCPVRQKCLDYAIDADNKGTPLHSVAGGYTYQERIFIQKFKQPKI